MNAEAARSVTERPSQLARLLGGARFEVIPTTGVIEKVRGVLATGATVTVTSSPRYGIDRSLETAEQLTDAGFVVVPHLAARMVSDRFHLERILERLQRAGIHEAFVVGGDASVPVGPFRDAGDLLEALASLPHSLRESVWEAIPRVILWCASQPCSRP